MSSDNDRVLSVAQSMAQESQMHLLQYQMQQFLERLNPLRPERFEVRIDWTTLVRFYRKASRGDASRWRSLPAETPSYLDETRATLFVLERIEPGAEPTIRWVIDVISDAVVSDAVVSGASTPSAEPSAKPSAEPSAESSASLSDSRAQTCARLAIADYWQLMPAQSALKTYHSPSPSGYQQQQLWHVGAQVSPTAIPEMSLRLQEPLPLYFLTRTPKGPRTHASRALPLQVCAVGEGEQ